MNAAQYVSLGVVSALWCGLMMYRFLRMGTPRNPSSMRSERRDLGEAVWIGVLAGAVWPVGVFWVWCRTGFAEGGIFQQRRHPQ